MGIARCIPESSNSEDPQHQCSYVCLNQPCISVSHQGGVWLLLYKMLSKVRGRARQSLQSSAFRVCILILELLCAKASPKHLQNAFKISFQLLENRQHFTGSATMLVVTIYHDYLIQLESSQDTDVARVFKEGPSSQAILNQVCYLAWPSVYN